MAKESPKGQSMLYVTQGTVQVERRTKADAVIFINPTQGFSIKHGKEDYIVFVSENALNGKGFDAQVFKKTQAFQTKGEDFIQILTEAAFNKTNIEIRINKVENQIKKEDEQLPNPITIKIDSVKIPATP